MAYQDHSKNCPRCKPERTPTLVWFVLVLLLWMAFWAITRGDKDSLVEYQSKSDRF